MPGSFGSEVGCAGDWQPECAAVAGQKYTLDPLQKSGSDLVVKASTYTAKSGTFTVPARSVAVFVRR